MINLLESFCSMLKNLSQETKIILGIVVITVVILIGAAIVLGNGSSTASTDQSSNPKADNGQLVTKESYQSNPGAKVTLVEFADFECPGCGAMYPVVKELQKEYGTKLNLVYHNFPLPMHPYAKNAVQSAIAAGDQGKFWQMHDLLFENQDTWAASTDSTSAQKLINSYAQSLHLNMTKYAQDQASPATISRMTTDLADGNTLGVNSTPTFYIDQHKYIGDYTLDAMKSTIDADLK